MTTIAYRDGTMCGDRRATTAGATVFEVCKVRKVDGWLIGLSGNLMAEASALDFLATRIKNGQPMTGLLGQSGWREDGANSIAGYAVSPQKIIHRIESDKDGNIMACEVDADFVACGSGRDYALAAMAMDASAWRAVEIAGSFDIYTGCGITEISLDPIAALSPAEPADGLEATVQVIRDAPDEVKPIAYAALNAVIAGAPPHPDPAPHPSPETDKLGEEEVLLDQEQQVPDESNSQASSTEAKCSVAGCEIHGTPPIGFTAWPGEYAGFATPPLTSETLVECWMGGADYIGAVAVRDMDWNHATDPVKAYRVVEASEAAGELETQGSADGDRADQTIIEPSDAAVLSHGIQAQKKEEPRKFGSIFSFGKKAEGAL